MPSKKSTATQSQAETALSVVLHKWDLKAIAERNALQTRLSELKRVYPLHFLGDDDIANPQTGVLLMRSIAFHLQML